MENAEIRSEAGQYDFPRLGRAEQSIQANQCFAIVFQKRRIAVDVLADALPQNGGVWRDLQFGVQRGSGSPSDAVVWPQLLFARGQEDAIEGMLPGVAGGE